jgi:16S rRNA (guanine(966)-N(2))-methyltransferase RsmD
LLLGKDSNKVPQVPIEIAQTNFNCHSVLEGNFKMRIIGGQLKSRKIDFPKTRATRPMTDRTKETLFNILGNLVFGKPVLDLFAGSGSVGLEALSRGALHVTFVDEAPAATKVIERNLASLELGAKATLIQTEVHRAIDRLSKHGQKFSLIFVDPPFEKGYVKKTLMKLDQSDIVSPFAQVVVGHSRKEEIPESLQSLKLARTKRIGQACLSFLFRMDATHGETKGYISGEF